MLNNYLFYFNLQISNNKFKNSIFFNIYNIIMNIQTNEVLMEILKKYVDYVFEKKNTEQEGFKMIKSKKNKHFKELESKGGIKESDIDTLVSKEHNINNLLTLIGNNRQQNSIKFK
jgi:hypothetical protein